MLADVSLLKEGDLYIFRIIKTIKMIGCNLSNEFRL